MPRGSDSFNKHKAAVEQRREDAQAQFGPKADFFGLKGGQFAAVRFLEQGTEIAWAAMHRIPVADRQYPQDVVCLDQEDDGTPCPFCRSEHKGIRARSTKGFYNVIWRGGQDFQNVNQQILANNATLIASGQPPQPVYQLAPVYKRNEWGSPEKGQDGNKVILGYADGIFLWKASKTVHDLIVSKDSTYQGLMTRDFVIRRVGNTKDDTVYYIDPLNVNVGVVPMTPDDQALATKKYELDKFISPMSFENASLMLSGTPSAGPQGTFDRGATPVGMPPVPGSLQQGVPDPNAPSPFSHPAPGTMAGVPQQ